MSENGRKGKSDGDDDKISINGNDLELIERRIADKVEETVRKRLIAIFGFAITLVVGTVGFIQYNVIEGARSSAVKNFDEKLKEIERNASDAVREAEKGFATQKDGIQRQLGEISASAQLLKLVAANAQEKIKVIEPHVDSLDELSSRLKEAEDVRSNLLLKIAQLKQREEESSTIPDKLAKLSQEVSALADSVKGILNLYASNPAAPPAMPQQNSAINDLRLTVDNVSQSAQKINRDTEVVAQAVTAVQDKSIVYLQFAGGARSRAEELSSYLKGKGYIVPGEERKSSAANQREVRYFYPEDEGLAKRVAGDVTEKLKDLGVNGGPVAVKPLLNYRSKNLPNIVELWIELP